MHHRHAEKMKKHTFPKAVIVIKVANSVTFTQVLHCINAVHCTLYEYYNMLMISQLTYNITGDGVWFAKYVLAIHEK